jgi:hypothetical protein
LGTALYLLCPSPTLMDSKSIKTAQTVGFWVMFWKNILPSSSGWKIEAVSPNIILRADYSIMS